VRTVRPGEIGGRRGFGTYWVKVSQSRFTTGAAARVLEFPGASFSSGSQLPQHLLRLIEVVTGCRTQTALLKRPTMAPQPPPVPTIYWQPDGGCGMFM
jgi:hypothetical protein